MQKQPESLPSISTDQKFSEKARILLDLFGPSGVDRLVRSGVDPRLRDALQRAAGSEVTAETAPVQSAGLIKRLRETGLLIEEDKKQEIPSRRDRTTAKTTPAPRPTPTTSLSTAQAISACLQDAHLEEEHPAVIAYVLRDQSSSIQARVLKALPGACARATRRHMMPR